ncbi:hypothetical protein QBC38DRAFT_488778 [Podospora fimiseda]|uniref:Uncharacterized protein n=1 Tax=Podospora fimiseda TaxID=252190 RepID=A0AAN7BEL8_9PEZI|nr:hypothetical protein QBC38DRAFT_488778 [Podospora fimiseda]
MFFLFFFFTHRTHLLVFICSGYTTVVHTTHYTSHHTLATLLLLVRAHIQFITHAWNKSCIISSLLSFVFLF